MDIPPDKSSNGIHWLPQSSTSRAAHTFEIREVSGSGEEKKLWQGSVAAGEKFQQDVVLDAYCRLKVYLDGKEVPTRFDIPEQDDTDGRMASAVD
jgi:hypothetical protein